MPLDFWHKLPLPLIYVVGVGIIVSLSVIRLGEVVAASQTIARALGPPGRWWHRRAEKRSAAAKVERMSEIREAFGTPEFRVLQRRIELLERMYRKLERETHAIMADREMDSAYLQEDAEWHTRVGVLAAELNFKMPKHRSYTQFCREWRIGHGVPKTDQKDDEARG